MPADTSPPAPEFLKIEVDDPPPPPPDPRKPKPPRTPSPPLLDTTVPLVMGELSYESKGQRHTLQFQFNPTELERSRTVKINRTPTGNNLEEEHGGHRNQAKRKASRKPEPWDMTLALKFDAAYHNRRPDDPPLKGPFKSPIARIEKAIRFFESLVDPAHHDHEKENPANADETPPPPFVHLQFGKRVWRCTVKTLRIKELDYTYDLYPRRFEATLGLEVIETVQQNDQGKPGATP